MPLSKSGDEYRSRLIRSLESSQQRVAWLEQQLQKGGAEEEQPGALETEL